MSRYKAYVEYKDSESQWLGLIPQHWVSSTLKYVTNSIGTGGTPKNASSFTDDEDVNWFSPGDFKGSLIIGDSSKYITHDSCRVGDAKLYEKGSVVVIGIGATLGKVAICNKNFSCNQQINVISPAKNILGMFLAYSLTVQVEQMKQISNASTIGIMNQEKTGALILARPPIKEQQTIANFLDHETAKIDTLIAKQQGLIKLLKEKRQAVISHAVTKGLNPNAPMRDSGVEWLGEVPAHWDVLGTKRFFSLQCNPAPDNNDMELLSVYTDIGVRPRKELEAKGNKASTTDGYWLVKKDDLIVNKLLAWMGAVGYSAYDGVTSPAYDILRKKRGLNTKFYHYLFRSKLAQSEFKRWSRGIMEMRLRLYFEELGRIGMPFPPESEQDQIVAKIETLEDQYDQLIDVANLQIELSQERRTALISAAVTGKIDVRDWLPASA
jgi:type I restriction enzyme S subunit